MTDEEFLSWWYNDFHWTWNYDPSQPLDSATVNYTLPAEVQNYLAAKGWVIKHSVMHNAINRHQDSRLYREKYWLEEFHTSILSQKRHKYCLSLSWFWYLKHIYGTNENSLSDLARRIICGSKNKNENINIERHYGAGTTNITRTVDIDYTVVLYITFANENGEPHYIIADDLKRCSYLVTLIS